MQVLVNRDGSRNRSWRPYIQDEELYRNIPLYDPNGVGPFYGLYERTQPPCMMWRDKLWQFEQRTHAGPSFAIDRQGVTHYPQNPTIGDIRERMRYTGGGVLYRS